jgi:TetR/AcrR family fatty acid metabolism transcriptional regulator
VRSKTPSQAEKILAAAARLFATQRFHEARMEDIAAAAEVGKGTLYRYFKDKEELYTALLDRAAEEMSGRLRECDARGGDARAKLVAVVATCLDYFDRNPYLFDLIQRAEVMQRPGRDFRWQQTRQDSIELVQRLLEEGRRAGDFDVADAHLAGLFLLGGLRAVMRFDKGPHTRDLPARLVDMFLHGVGRCQRMKEEG